MADYVVAVLRAGEVLVDVAASIYGRATGSDRDADEQGAANENEPDG